MPIQYKEKDETSVISIGSNASRIILRELQAIKKELDDGEITKKGYEKRRKEILTKYKDVIEPNEGFLSINKEIFENRNINGNYDFESKNEFYDKDSDNTKSYCDQTYCDHEYLLEDSDNYKNGRSLYEQSNSISSEKLPAPFVDQVAKQQLPFKPRGIPFSAYDRHDPRFLMTKFDNIASVFRYRSRMASRKKAIIVSDNKGKEMYNITYNKLLARTEKVAQAIKSKPDFQQGNRVALIYSNFEIIDFVISLFACFIAGAIAVPINNYKDITELHEILISTQSRLILTTHINLKNLRKMLIDRNLQFPFMIEWWETNKFGGFYSKKKHSSAPLQTHDLAYIEYSRSPTGELRGVVIPHATIVNQMISLSTAISSIPKYIKKQILNRNSNKKHAAAEDNEVFITYLDQRQAIGLIFTVFFSIYSGSTTVWCSQKAVSVPGLLANLITKYRVTMILANYPGLKTVAYNYQDDPMQTRKFKKKYTTDFSSIRLCLIDCVCVDSEFHEILADRWLRPLGNSRPWDVLSPILCLPEHGGMVISMRDWLGGEQQMLSEFPDNNNIYANNELSQVLLSKEALKTNKVVILSEENKMKGKYDGLDAVRVGSFWYPLADITLAIVDPETSIFCNSNVIGEIWVDSPSLSGGFWNSPQQTKSLFHAEASVVDNETSNLTTYNQEFLRTGLLGCMIRGRIYVLGLYEDRLRQRIVSTQDNDTIEYMYHYVSHIVQTIMRNVPHVFDCTSFDIFINGEYYPIVVLELPASIISPDPSEQSNVSDYNVLDTIIQKCKKVLLDLHNIKVYCIMLALSNTLPRVNKNGHKEISNMLCRKGFELGTLPCEHVKFFINEVTLDLPVGEDPVGGIWSKIAVQKRQELLCSKKKQYSAGDERALSMDDRTLINLFTYGTIIDVLQWRVASQSDEPALSVIDSRGKDKSITWKKLDLKIANVANYLKFKIKLQSGDHAILMYTQSDDFLYAIHACFCLGIIAIPIPPLNTFRLSEDIPSFLGVISDFKIKAVLVNNQTDSTFKSKLFSYNIKRYAPATKIVLPNIINTSKSPKQTLGCVESGFMLDQEWIDLKIPALIWLYWSPDRRRTAVELGHETIMSCCRIQKETCQMSSSRPLLGCMQATTGIGFLHSYILGIYMGATTYLVSPRDFVANPLILFDSIAKFKVKDTYIAPEALNDAIEAIQTKDTCLHELRNLMITFNCRPQFDYFQRVKNDFSESILDPNSLSNVYYSVLNPMITTRSYMSTEPIHLYLNVKSLRQGIIEPIDMADDPSALLLYDSGTVSVSTRIAIVNPETCDLCCEGEYGEIWVASDANMKSFYGSKNKMDLERFHGVLANNNNNNQKDIYVRTGDLGFLYNIQRPIGPEGLLVETQSLFILGNIGDTFEINGLLYFPIDIETSVEKSHNNILPGGSAIFQTGRSIIILIEVKHKSNLPSIVPVVVNTVLNKYQIIIDTVVFTAKGDFPRSRVGEKQRGKILELWLTKKLELLDEFIIRQH